ncbi:MAG TPA: ATP-binding protein [Terriglobia bacterium]|nr:ATP-binding protein [Terriglobia bacterium]
MKKNQQHEPRELMELAIEVMRQSVPKPRDDGKTSSKVGAVQVKPDGMVKTACRGELWNGDHAEFTLLERKNRGNELDGSILFATFQPCAPGARRDPKVDCAERIRLARIKEVWIGIQDPDPKVARKAIAHLEQSGIKVHMFDRDLQAVIEKENKEFLAQALDRAAAAKQKPVEVVLSPLENKLPAAVLADFSNEALGVYRERAGIADAVGSDEFNRHLLQQGELKEEDGRLVPTGFGILLFGKEPRRAMRQAGLLAAIQYPNGEQERKEFDEPAVMIPDLLEKWLRDKLPNVFRRDKMRRQERAALPFEMVREAVVNALIHRDYDIRQAKCQLAVTTDTITVRSPGGPLPPITLEQLRVFTAPMLSRNPELHYVFSRMGMAEEMGFGLKSLKNRAEQLGLPLPRYSWEDPYLVLTLYRSPEAAQRALAPDALESLSTAERKGWQWLTTQETVTAIGYAAALGIPKRTALNHLKHFAGLGLLRRIGTGPSTKYEISGP